MSTSISLRSQIEEEVRESWQKKVARLQYQVDRQEKNLEEYSSWVNEFLILSDIEPSNIMYLDLPEIPNVLNDFGVRKEVFTKVLNYARMGYDFEQMLRPTQENETVKKAWNSYLVALRLCGYDGTQNV